MIVLISDIDRACQCIGLLLSLVRDNIFMGFKVFLWFILDVNPLHRLGLCQPGLSSFKLISA